MANDDVQMSQDEIERLFSQAKEPAAAKGPAAGGHQAPVVAVGGKEDPALGQDDIEKLLSEAGRSRPAAVASPPPRPLPGRLAPSLRPPPRRANRTLPRRTSNSCWPRRKRPWNP